MSSRQDLTPLSSNSEDQLQLALIVFVLIPLAFNAVLMGMYFSGISTLQQVVAPTIEWLVPNNWREFGALEQLQNGLLLATLVILVLGALNKRSLLDRACMALGALVFLFLLLEEIDYGIHFYEYFTGRSSGIEVRNWHNQRVDGTQNVKRFKQLVDVMIVLLFVVLPLARNRIRSAFLRNIAPSRWFVLGLLLAVLYSKFAHVLDDRGLGRIDGVEGNLSGNISEFRELSNYYFFMLYALQLYRLETIIPRR